MDLNMRSGFYEASRRGNARLTENINIPRSEYDRLRQAERYYGARYDAAATEMRRKENQAHQQLKVAVDDMEKLQARVKELEEAASD